MAVRAVMNEDIRNTFNNISEDYDCSAGNLFRVLMIFTAQPFPF